MPICPVILAGGSGSRLWPLSRQHYPKQFINMFGDLTMLQQTLLRLSGNRGALELLPSQIICNEAHRFMVIEQARSIGHEIQEVVLEPVGRNTAPALTVAALWQLRSGNDAVLLMMPADHLIKNNQAFQDAITLGYQHAEDTTETYFDINLR